MSARMFLNRCRILPLVVITMFLATAGWAPPVSAQATQATITATVYNCPPGMTPDTLVGEDCTLAPKGFSIAIFTLGSDDFLTLDDATTNGASYTWSPGPAAADDTESANYGIRETVLPTGYTSFVVYGPSVVGEVGDIVHLRIIESAPNAEVTIYNFAHTRGESDKATPAAQLPSTGAGSTAENANNQLWTLVLFAMLFSGVVLLCKRNA